MLIVQHFSENFAGRSAAIKHYKVKNFQLQYAPIIIKQTKKFLKLVSLHCKFVVYRFGPMRGGGGGEEELPLVKRGVYVRGRGGEGKFIW